MKTNILFFFIIIFTSFSIAFSQNPEKDLINKERVDSAGIQLKTLSSGTREKTAPVLCPGYVFRNPKQAILGSEISESFYNNEFPWMESYGVSLAIYTGTTGSSSYKFHALGEHSNLNNFYLDMPIEQYGRENNIYMAPGISLYSKNRKISLGIYQKLSTPFFFNGNQKSVPLKANFRF